MARHLGGQLRWRAGRTGRADRPGCTDGGARWRHNADAATALPVTSPWQESSRCAGLRRGWCWTPCIHERRAVDEVMFGTSTARRGRAVAVDRCTGSDHGDPRDALRGVPSPSPAPPSTRWGGSTMAETRPPPADLPADRCACRARQGGTSQSEFGDPRQARRVLPWLRRGNSGRRRPDPSLRGRLGPRGVLPLMSDTSTAAAAVSPSAGCSPGRRAHAEPTRWAPEGQRRPG